MSCLCLLNSQQEGKELVNIKNSGVEIDLKNCSFRLGIVAFEFWSVDVDGRKGG